MLLKFEETKQLLKKYNLELKNIELFNNEKDAILFAKKIGFPVVLKVYSEKIIHKTEKQGVIIDINNEKEFKQKYKKLNNDFKEKEGLIVQKQFKGQELVIGAKRDKTFGPFVMVGLGGIFVELLNDVSFGVCPINKKQALEMIYDFKGHETLIGFRNREKCNIKALTNILVNLSKLMLIEKDISAIDFNPVFINKENVSIADFRIIKT